MVQDQEVGGSNPLAPATASHNAKDGLYAKDAGPIARLLLLRVTHSVHVAGVIVHRVSRLFERVFVVLRYLLGIIVAREVECAGLLAIADGGRRALGR